MVAFTPLTVRAQYGGSIIVPSNIYIRGVCGDASRGILYVLGTYYSAGTYYGVVFRVINLTTWSIVAGFNPTIINNFQVGYTHACEIVDNYLFLVGSAYNSTTTLGQFAGLILVYDISNPDNPSFLDGVYGYNLWFVDVEVRRVDTTYYVYVLSDIPPSPYNTTLVYTTFTGGELSITIYRVTLCYNSVNCLGYGMSLGRGSYSDHLAVSYRDANNNLNTVVFNLTSGVGQVVQLVANYGDTRAPVDSYSGGFLVAAGGNFYRVYLSGGSWTSETYMTSVYSGPANSMVVSEENGAAIGAYVFSNVSTSIYVTAVDLVSKRVAYTEAFTSMDSTESLYFHDYGDPVVVWIDSSDNIVPAGTSGARPYMVDVYTSTRLVYYDLTRGGSLPYPIPEPWLVVLGVLVPVIVFIVVKTHGHD
jgi:hypothetical protein